MRQWIGVQLPLLSLEALRPRWCEAGPHVVMEQNQVLALTPEAAAMGVRHGLRRGGVNAIAPLAILHERDMPREQEAMDAIALALLQFTPEVALAAQDSLLLDVTASLKAFGGRLALCRRVRASVEALGFTLRLSMAPTAMGAWLLAALPDGPTRQGGAPWRRSRRRLRLASLARHLDRLPFLLLPAARAHRDWLDGVGCRTLADVRRLPRAGLQRRCGHTLLDELDRAYGEAPELFEWVQAPPRFIAKLELPDRIEHAEAVLFGARRLLLQMTGWLVARHLAVTRFVLLMEHERGRMAVPPTPLEITLAEAAWQEAHLTRLLKERLGRLQLSGPVVALKLEALQTGMLAPPSDSLFPEPGGTPADYRRLLELLTARLGAEAVLAPAPLADYRPEICNRWLPATELQRQRIAFAHAAASERPFWLLEKPLALLMRDHRPFYGSPLRLVNGPERIECGWWDDAFAVRDYFVAQGADAACYWIYRERDEEGEVHWFLHGLFA
jgi:protein ImuB